MKNSGGFTILETIITLTVSSILFVTVMITFNGRQGRVEFSQGLRDIEAYIRDVANDVQDGYFPKPTNLFCSTTPLGAPVIQHITTTRNQGTSFSCIYAGKVMYFDGANSSQTINTYSMAGRRDATSQTNLFPTIISANDASGITYSTLESYKLPAGIQLVDGNAMPTATVIALFFDISAVSASSGGVSAVLPTGLSLGSNDIGTLSSSVNNAFNTLSSTVKPLKNLCFKSGTSNQYGTISITKGINGLTTSLLIGPDKFTDCAVQQ